MMQMRIGKLIQTPSVSETDKNWLQVCLQKITADIIDFYRFSIQKELDKMWKGDILTANERKGLFRLSSSMIDFLIFGCNDYVLMNYPWLYSKI